MSDYPDFIVTTVPFRGKRLLYVLLLMMLAAAAFLFVVEVYVSTHKHKQPPPRSIHGHTNSTPRSSMDPGASPSR